MTSDAVSSVSTDELAQIIRQVDGNNSLGAGALAEAINAAIALRTSKAGWVVQDAVFISRAFDPTTAYMFVSPAPAAMAVTDADCEICHRPYANDLLVDDAVWERIQPDNGVPGAGLICPDCILTRTGWACGFAVDGHAETISSEIVICGQPRKVAQPVAVTDATVSVPRRLLKQWRELADNISIGPEPDEALALLSSSITVTLTPPVTP